MIVKILDVLSIVYPGKLSAHNPAVSNISSGQHVSDCIIGHCCAVPVHKLVFPDRSIRSCFCSFRESRKLSCGICILLHLSQISSQIILVDKCLILGLAVFTDQLVPLVIAESICLYRAGA